MLEPTLLYWPPICRAAGLRCTVIVIDSAVIGAVFAMRICSSMNHGLLLARTGVTVTDPEGGTAVTDRATVVERVPTAALLPLIVTVALPSVAVAEALSVSTALFAVVDAGLNVAETPAGSPLVEKATAPVNPHVREIAIVTVPLAPLCTDKLVGAGASEKFAVGAPTVKETPLLATLPTVTVTVTGPAAMFGTVATICELLHDVTVATAVLKRTALAP